MYILRIDIFICEIDEQTVVLDGFGFLGCILRGSDMIGGGLLLIEIIHKKVYSVFV